MSEKDKSEYVNFEDEEVDERINEKRDTNPSESVPEGGGSGDADAGGDAGIGTSTGDGGASDGGGSHGSGGGASQLGGSGN